MGFLEVAAAIKFLSNADLVWDWQLLTRETFLSIWIACGVLIVVYLLGFIKMKLDWEIYRLSAARTVWAIVFASVTIYLFSGLFGKPLGELDAFLPPKGYGGSAAIQSGIGLSDNSNATPAYNEAEWYKDYNKALEVAKKRE